MCPRRSPFWRQKSRDFHWYSPVLTPQLQNCVADVVVQPRSEDEIAAIVTAAVKRRIPLTLRGGGTGNYGQSVPLQGGVLVDMIGFNKVLAVEPGRLVALDRVLALLERTGDWGDAAALVAEQIGAVKDEDARATLLALTPPAEVNLPPATKSPPGRTASEETE